jgi:hypothetical protein
VKKEYRLNILLFLNERPHLSAAYPTTYAIKALHINMYSVLIKQNKNI